MFPKSTYATLFAAKGNSKRSKKKKKIMAY